MDDSPLSAIYSLYELWKVTGSFRLRHQDDEKRGVGMTRGEAFRMTRSERQDEKATFSVVDELSMRRG